MKYYLIAGERSGDLHGGNMLKALKKKDADAKFRGFGGDEMKAAGMEVTVHYKDLAFMGFWEVARNIGTIRKRLIRCKNDLLEFNPDILVLIDYAGFNLRMAAFARKKNIPVLFYISPKIWAWNQRRGWKIKKLVDRMLCILPFEKEFYKKFDMDVAYVGNPVLDAVNDFKQTASENHMKDHIALLPGSRLQEVRNVIPLLPELVTKFPNQSFHLACVNNIDTSEYDALTVHENVVSFEGKTYDLLQHAHTAIVVSGTATLETALFKVPQVVIYSTSPITYSIVKRLIAVDFISLVNLIAGREIVKELIQDQMNGENLENELERLLQSDYREKMLSDYEELEKILDTGNRASENAAQEVFLFARNLTNS